MTSYKDKVMEALSFAETVDDIILIESKIRSTDSINRRTVEGREITQDLLKMCSIRLNELIDKNGITPF